MEITREELHFRRIDMRGYRRSDGLYEVEGRVVDCKPHEAFLEGHGRVLRANESMHDMGVRLVFDEDMVVREVHAFTDVAPYPACPEGGRALQAVVGLSMTRGWSREVGARLGGARSCTHLKELLVPMATAAFQSLTMLRLSRPPRRDGAGRPVKIDSCYAYAAAGEVVRARWPEFHRAAPDERGEA